jgi:hypothetical protein
MIPQAERFPKLTLIKHYTRRRQMTEETKTKENAVAKYNKCIDEAMAALAELVKEREPGGWITFRECGRQEGEPGKVAFTGGRNSVKVQPGRIPLRGSSGALFYKITAPDGTVKE